MPPVLDAPVAEPTGATGGAFRTITTFVGDSDLQGAMQGAGSSASLIESDTPGTWHAQVGQDRTVARLFENRRGGYFIDLASNEPIYISNTRTLE